MRYIQFILLGFSLFCIGCGARPLEVTKTDNTVTESYLLSRRDSGIVIAPFTMSRRFEQELISASTFVSEDEIKRLYRGGNSTGYVVSGVFLGMLGGGITGGIIGTNIDENDGDDVVAFGPMLGVILGAVTGAIIGGIVGDILAPDETVFYLHDSLSEERLRDMSIYPTEEPDELKKIK